MNSFKEYLIYVPRFYNNKYKNNPKYSKLAQTNIPCLYVPNDFLGSSKIMIYFHANGEDIGSSYTLLRYLTECFKMNVLGIEYPGYGIYKNTPTGEAI